MRKMKKIISIVLACSLLAGVLMGMTSCSGEKNITVVAREQGSGTREAFDKVVTDGNGNYLEMKVDGKKVYNTTANADIQKETGNVMSKVASDKNAIGYISLGSVNDTVKVVSVNGVTPSAQTVLDGTYVIQRPFVIMTNSTVELTEITKDFLDYLKSGASEAHAQASGCIWLSDSASRANEGQPAIPVSEYSPKSTLPSGGKITINGSTSMEKFIKNAMSGYASLYGRTADELFTLDLQGSSVGKSAAKNDTNGNVIGLSSASVNEEGINSFNVCLDAVAVIVNKSNDKISNLTLNDLYDIFSGNITKFSEIKG
ncbi:MAG: substrate-binding domain-containing protein [Eubacteriales bacterium]|nr:substrate-binding domain-containing protein [Eubacteriales bacterium]